MISIVIPARDEGERLAAALRDLEALRGDFEVVVCWTGRCSFPPATRYPLRAEAARETGRGSQLSRGATLARGGLLVFLHADTRLPEGALEEASRLLADPRVAGGGWRLAFDRDHPALRLLSGLSSLPWRTAFYGDQGFFCRRRDFLAVGGYPALPLFEDVALARRLARRGRLVRAAGTALTSARRFVDRGPWRQLGAIAALVALYWMGASPRWLERWYRGGRYSYLSDSMGSSRAARRAG
jgi:hypothetical protein